jgi:hypothetical protein
MRRDERSRTLFTIGRAGAVQRMRQRLALRVKFRH